MKKFKLILVLLFSFLVAITGCSTSNTPKPSKPQLKYTNDLSAYGVNWYRPHSVESTEDKENGVKYPAFSGNMQRFGKMSFGDSKEADYLFAVDLSGVDENISSAKFYFDSNRNKDLTDDGQPLEISKHAVKVPDFNIVYQNGSIKPYSFAVYDYFRNGKYRISYYRDCGWVGKAKIGSQLFPILLMDDNDDGIYDTKNDYMAVDLNRNGIPEGNFETGELIKNGNAFFVEKEAFGMSKIAPDGTEAFFKSIPISVLKGLVTSTSKDKLEGSTIEALSSIVVKSITNSDGTYSMRLPEGDWRLAVAKYGYIPDYGRVTIKAGQTSQWNIELSPLPFPNDGTVTLKDGDSYDFAKKEFDQYTGGDFYFGSKSFWSNNWRQRGVQDLGNIALELKDVVPPKTGYHRQGVRAIEGHTYVSLARHGEEGNYIAFKVISVSDSSVTIKYHFIMAGEGN